MRGWVVVLGVWGGAAFAQGGGAAFEAATVKRFPEGATITMSGCQGGPGSNDPGRIRCEYVSLKMLLMQAYQVKSQEIFGPAWLDADRFNIEAKVPQGTTREQKGEMFRTLLAERFHVEAHREERMLPGYSITVAKGGLKIQEAGAEPAEEERPNGPPPTGPDGFPILRRAMYRNGSVILYRRGRARLQGGAVTIASLAESLSRQLDRVVVDETGLTAKYDITMNWTPERGEPGALPQETSDPGATIFMAMEQQLGLKLATSRVKRQALVVDRAERTPAEN